MSNSKFEVYLERLTEFGFEMDPRIKQKNNDGLLGMYATELIPKGTTLSRFPISMKIPRSNSIDFSGGPHEEVFSLVHTLAKELSDQNSRYKFYFDYCGTLEDRKKQSVCYFTQEEFRALAQMNPLLAQSALLSKYVWEQTVQTVCMKDPTLDKEHVMLATFIHRERCWSEGIGFLPGMDLFNHNTKSKVKPQRTQLRGEECITYVAHEDIKSGDEIKITYGNTDMYRFACNYDFFDPNDFHIISHSSRITQTISDDFIQKVVENLKKYYEVNIFQMNGNTKFKVEESRAFFLEQGPNTKMVELISRLAINNDAELKRGKADDKTAARYMLYILQSFKKANNVKSISKESLPKKIHRFHDMLTSELKILESNIRYIKPKCMEKKRDLELV